MTTNDALFEILVGMALDFWNQAESPSYMTMYRLFSSLATRDENRLRHLCEQFGVKITE